MFTVSLCMIVRDEEDVLSRCLDSVRDVVDEIIIVDTGSSDQTKEIARRYTEQIYDFKWVDDFSAARNFSFSKASMDYAMWLDADDVMEVEDRRGFLQMKSELDAIPDMIMMKYHVSFGPDGKPTFSYYRERLMKRSKGFVWNGEVHEVVAPEGDIHYSELGICHRKLKPPASGRNLKIYEAMREQGKTFEPRQQFYYARELYYNGRYMEAASQFDLFLAEGRGWVENNINACRDLASCLTKLSAKDQSLLALYRSFLYDSPRAEVCCDIGSRLLEDGKYKMAAYWYEEALNCTLNEQSGAFCEVDCYGYIPYMQLCVCYDRMGDLEKAGWCNTQAGLIKPEDPSYLYNKSYFERL